MNRQKGFTLIELVMVIVLLGILSAIALPRFADLSGNAEAAVVRGALASAKSTSAIVHASALAEKNTGATGELTMEGLTFALVNGYPDAGGAGTNTGQPNGNGFGIAQAANLDSDYVLIYFDETGGLFDEALTATTASTQLIVTSKPIRIGSSCFIYQEAANPSSAPDFSPLGSLGGAAGNYSCS